MKGPAHSQTTPRWLRFPASGNSAGSRVPSGLNGVVAIAAGWAYSLALKSDGTVVGWGSTVPAGLSQVVAIAAGAYHSLALKDDGTVVAWGSGIGTNVPFGLNGVVAISAGASHSLALKSDGTVVAWGDDSFGQSMAPGGLSGVVAIAAGWDHSLALRSDGTVVAWGDDSFGQSMAPGGLSGVVAISARQFHNLALKGDGTVAVWGSNDYGQNTVPSGLSGVVAVSAGVAHSLALKADGRVVAWGWNSFGETNVPAGLSGVVATASGAYHSLALKDDGTVVAWGSNSYGQSTVPAGLTHVVEIAAGGYHSLALKSDGTVVAWGDNIYGQTNVPAGLVGVVAIAAGADHSLALKSDGTVVVWGDNIYGQTNVPAGLSGVESIAGGDYDSLALKSDGTVVGWGAEPRGETNILAGLNNVVAIAAGGDYSLALVSESNQIPSIQSQPFSQTAQAGNSVVLAVTAIGTLPLNYQWLKNGVNIPDATNATLTLNSVTAADAGVYSVVVSNPYGSVTSSLASLVIQGDPANWNPSFVSVAPQTAPADGQPHVTATVTLLDNNKNPLVGKTVLFYAPPGSTAPIPAPAHPTDSKGQTTTTITSTTAGKVTIGALDVSDGFPVPNLATVQFTTGTVAPGTDLANAITQLANSSSDILVNRLAIDAVSEGQDGDYFQATLSGDERKNGANALFTGVGGLIKLLGPEADLITKTAVTLGLQAGKTGVSDALDAIANSDTGPSTYGQTIADNNNNYQQSELAREQQLLNGVPPAAQNLSSPYASDIALRVQANQDLNAIILAQKNLILNLRLQSEQAHIDLLSKVFLPVKVVSTVAEDCVPVYGKPAGMALNLAESFDSYAFNQPNLSFGANAVNTVETAMLNCSYYSRLVDGNTESAFGEIAAGRSPSPITGKMSSVNSVLTYVPVTGLQGVVGNLFGWVNGTTYVTETGAYSDIAVQNNKAQTATYSVNAVYWVSTYIKDQFGDALVPITIPYTASTSVTIPGNQSAQVRLNYFANGADAAPDPSQPITIFLLGYDGNNGIYEADSATSHAQWQLDSGVSSVTKAKPLGGPIPAGGPTATNLFAMENPIDCYVVQNPSNQTYQAHIVVANQFAIPLQAVVTQPLPAGISVLSTSGLVSGASIIWTNTIVTNGLVDDTFTFTLPVLPGMQTNLPAPTLVFSDSTGTNSWTTQAAAATFGGLFPIQVAGSIPSGAFGVDTPMQIAVTNLVGASENGSMTISVTDLNGNAVTNFSVTFSVSGAAGTNLNFSLPGTLPVGQYFISGTLSMNGGTGEVLSGVYVVPQIPLMLHPGVPGLLSTNGMNLSLQGPIGSNYVVEASADLVNWTPLVYFTSTNSPTDFTDTTATNSSTRFYRAVMVSVTTALPWLQAQISGGKLIVSWPASATGYGLETSTNLADTNSWTALANVPTVINGQDVVTNGISDRVRFYRLKAQ
jgi:alpha-tubulin suppressor-like RCC1 family protein